VGVPFININLGGLYLGTILGGQAWRKNLCPNVAVGMGMGAQHACSVQCGHCGHQHPRGLWPVFIVIVVVYTARVRGERG